MLNRTHFQGVRARRYTFAQRTIRTIAEANYLVQKPQQLIPNNTTPYFIASSQNRQSFFFKIHKIASNPIKLDSQVEYLQHNTKMHANYFFHFFLNYCDFLKIPKKIFLLGTWTKNNYTTRKSVTSRCMASEEKVFYP